MNAIGMIETRGLLAAIEGADCMLKAADVSLISKNSATGGLITITVTGEVAAVQTAVESAAVSIHRLNSESLISKHVIARPCANLESVIGKIPSITEKQVERMPPSLQEEQVLIEAQNAVKPYVDEKTIEPQINLTDEGFDINPVFNVDTIDKPRTIYSKTKLQRMKVDALREIVNGLPNITLKTDVEKATKKELIKAICDNKIIKGRK